MKPLRLLTLSTNMVTFIFLINHLRLQLLLLSGSPVLISYPLPCRFPQKQRERKLKTHLSMTLLLGERGVSLLTSSPQGLCCLWVPAWHLLMPLWVQIPVSATSSGVSYTWVLALTCWATLFIQSTSPEWLGPEAFPDFTTKGITTESPCPYETSRTLGPILDHQFIAPLPSWEIPFGAPVILFLSEDLAD